MIKSRLLDFASTNATTLVGSMAFVLYLNSTIGKCESSAYSHDSGIHSTVQAFNLNAKEYCIMAYNTA